MIFFELAISLFDALICVYFISRFNGVPLSVSKNRLALPAVAVIFAFSVINDLLLEGFNVVGTAIFLALYITYALLICNKNYVRALFSACIFEIVFVLLSTLLYFIISHIIKDFDALMQGTGGIFRVIYLIIHKICLFVVLRLVLMGFKSDCSIEPRHGILAFSFSIATVLGLGSTMYLASRSDARDIQIQAMIITLAFTFANVALYLLIFNIQRYQRDKYELSMLQEKIELERARHNEASAMWTGARQMQHDMKQHLTVILGLAETDPDACAEYIQKLLPEVSYGYKIAKTDNFVLDYLINSKLSRLTDTRIVISGSVGDLSDIKDTDLACLIGNILDNAVSALDEVKSSDSKRLELLFMNQNSNRIIICKNTVAKPVLSQGKELVTTKNEPHLHGYGTKIISKIVCDYHGMVDYFEEFGMFGVQIILPKSRQ
ncbi:MAG: GHKL domain-containing protein [Clostridia bacterium]|nr:GHKL domain-containing protein [Clostridia bacterium]MBQ8739780.1 GHKL domain-containing protein [Clostridia bacterium]